LTIAILIGCNSSDSDGSGDETEIDGVAFEYTGALQFYTVPDDAVALNIAALGASGGDAENKGATSILRGGYGAIVEMTIDVTPGDLITILLGQQPQLQVQGDNGCGASGGGGSFVVANYDETGGGEGGASADPLAVAGAGGGSSGGEELDGQDASITKDGVSSVAALGGTNGGGGRGGYAAGGGGFFNNGQDGDDLTIFSFRSRGGKSFTMGGAGGAHFVDTDGCGDVAGGYGGGGGGEYFSGAGGGGGYSGGAGTDDESGGGGGGSFDASDAGDISIRTQHGHGRVIIEAVF